MVRLMVILNLKSHGYHWNEDSKFQKKYVPKPVIEYKIITPPKHYLVPPQKNNSKMSLFWQPGTFQDHFFITSKAWINKTLGPESMLTQSAVCCLF